MRLFSSALFAGILVRHEQGVRELRTPLPSGVHCISIEGMLDCRRRGSPQIFCCQQCAHSVPSATLDTSATSTVWAQCFLVWGRGMITESQARRALGYFVQAVRTGNQELCTAANQVLRQYISQFPGMVAEQAVDDLTVAYLAFVKISTEYDETNSDTVRGK